LEVLSLVRSMKNTLAPINRIPQEVLSLIPGHSDTDEDLIALTHVCRGWRELFISRSSLWIFLDCTDVDKTRVYLERSRTSPLEIYLKEEEDTTYLNDAFLLTVPHLGRLGSLTLSGSSNDLVQLVKHLASPAPLLEKLKLTFTRTRTLTIQGAIFGGNLSSLRELRLSGVIADKAWENMSNLRTFDLRQIQTNKISVTQLLNVFERAPLLRKIHLRDAFPTSSDASPGRVVPLPNLKFLTIAAQPVHTVLLNHLLIPAGASVQQCFNFSDEKSPIPAYLPKTINNLNHLSHITSVNLAFDSGMLLRLDGPSGGLYLHGHWVGEAAAPHAVDRRVLRSLTLFRMSKVESLAIVQYRASLSTKVEKSPVYLTLLLLNNLRTLILTNCSDLPFISALTPGQNPSRTVVCPNLEELVLYVNSKDRFCINGLLKMAEDRASRSAKLSTITIVVPQEIVPAKEVLKLRNHVSHVEYRLDDTVPEWDDVPGDTDDPGCESDW